MEKKKTNHFNKNVYIIMLDQIFNEEVPVDKVSWWIDINDKQCIAGYQYTDYFKLSGIAIAKWDRDMEDKE